MKNEFVMGKRESEQGIALVIVLGFLSILTVMAVSFAINMRTERLTSNMYLDSTRARHFLDVATTRALADIDAYMINNNLRFPDFDFFASSGTTIDTNLFIGNVVNYLPASWNPGPPASEFVIIPNPVNPALPPLGRYAYLAVNLTGFLDMNFVGTALARNAGRDPGEITISDSVLPDVLNSSQWGGFRSDLENRWRRMENLYEFQVMAAKHGISTPQNFIHISRSLPELTPEDTDKINLGGSKADLVGRKAAIVDALQNKCDIPGSVVDGVFNSILDFVDTDVVPEDPMGLSAEPVPMINEIVASGRFTKQDAGGGQAIYSLQDFSIKVEYWYPFPISGSDTFSSDPDANFSIATDPGLPASMFKDIVMNLNPTNGATKPTLYLKDDTSIPTGEFNVNKRGYYVVEYRYPTKSYQTNDTPNLPRMPVEIQVKDLKVFFGQAIVDQVELPQTFQLRIDQNSTDTKGISCNDPRLNHLKGGNFWQTELVTLEALNNNVDGAEEIGSDPVMYSRNFPLDQEKVNVGYGSVADLGFISIGTPWRTIALYRNPGKFEINPVLDYFTVITTGGTGKQYGKVNLNSRRRDALASVFYDMPVNAAPEVENTVLTFDSTKARQMADAIQAVTLTTPFDRLSQIGELPTVYSSSFDASLDSDARIESIIRNSVNLFTLRDNVFGIIIETQTLSEDNVVTSIERALAMVWRDPYPDPVNGLHNTIVRSFVMLEE